MLNELAKEVHEIAVEKGWYEDGRGLLELVMLIVTECSEVVESYRNGESDEWRDDAGKPCGVHVEIADILIRTLDMSAYLGIDLDRVVREKIAYNRTRPHRHGGKRA